MLLRRVAPRAAALVAVPARALHLAFPLRRPAEPPLPPPSLVQRLGDNTTALTGIAVGGGALATLSGYYVFDAESQILGLFALFVGSIYYQGGPAIAKFLDEQAEAIQKEQNALEEVQLAAAKLALDAHTKQATVFGDIQAVFEGQVGLMKLIVQTQGGKLKHEVRNKAARQLDHLVSAEASAKARYERELVDKATAAVTKVFSSPKAAKIKAKALDTAFAQLKDPKAASKKDPVSALFKAYFAMVKKKAAKSKGKDVALSAKARASALDAAKTAQKREGLDKLALAAPTKVKM